MPKQETKRARTEEEAGSSEEGSSDDEWDVLDALDDDEVEDEDQEGGESGPDDDDESDMDDDDEQESDDELRSDDELESDDDQESGESDDDEGASEGEKKKKVSSKKAVKVKSKDAGEEPKKKDKRTKGNFNPDTSMYVTSRSFGAFTGEALQKYIAGKGFTVKTVYKHPPKNRFAFVDFGTVEESQRALKELNGIDCKGSKIIVDIIKSADVIERSKTNLDSQRKPPTSSLTNRFLFVKNISPQYVSRKTLKDIFTKSESIIFPSQKGGTLREALVIFPKESQLDDAIKMFQGSEIGGHKLCLERLTAVPAESVEGDDTANGEKESTKEEKLTTMKEKKSPKQKVSNSKEKQSTEPPKKKKKLQNKN